MVEIKGLQFSEMETASKLILSLGESYRLLGEMIRIEEGRKNNSCADALSKVRLEIIRALKS